MRKKQWIVAIGMALALGLWNAACARKSEQAAPSAARPTPAAEEHHEGEMPSQVSISSAAVAEAGIQTWLVKPVDLEHLLILNGNVGLDENRVVQVAAYVSGRVTSIPVDLGARVRAGDPLVVVESIELGRAREEYLREFSALRVSEPSYARAKRLVEAKAISAGEFQSREGEYLARKAAADAAERALQLLGESEAEIGRWKAALESGGTPPAPGVPRLTLRAPFDGEVIDRKVTPGSLVEAHQPLLTLADLSKVWVFLQVYEKDLAQVREGLPVTIRTEAYPQESFSGRLDFVSGILDPSTRAVRVRATVGNPAGKLKPGMFVKASVDVPRPAEEAKAIVAIPQAALQTLEGRPTVFVRTAEGTFQRRFVEIGHSFEGFTEILSGVRPGEAVVTEGSFVLKSEFAKASLAEEH